MIKGYYTGSGYMGWYFDRYILYSTEREYVEIMREDMLTQDKFTEV